MPLCFNFLRLTQIKNSHFQSMMGQMDQGFFPEEAGFDLNNNCTPLLDKMMAKFGIA